LSFFYVLLPIGNNVLLSLGSIVYLLAVGSNEWRLRLIEANKTYRGDPDLEIGVLGAEISEL